MGLRFRKTFKLAPGIRINVNKKSTGLSIGGKGGGISFNSKTGTTVHASAVGTGLSYRKTFSSKSSNSRKTYKEGINSSTHMTDQEDQLTLFLSREALESLNFDALLDYWEEVQYYAEKIKVGDDALYGERMKEELRLMGNEFKRRKEEIPQKVTTKDDLIKNRWLFLALSILLFVLAMACAIGLDVNSYWYLVVFALLVSLASAVASIAGFICGNQLNKIKVGKK